MYVQLHQVLVTYGDILVRKEEFYFTILILSNHYLNKRLRAADHAKSVGSF